MKLKEIIPSAQDLSVNFVFDNGQEARYVRRDDDYFIVYLSSHNGCNQACRFCHLTQTKQTSMVPTTFEEYVLQAKVVLGHYQREVKTGNQPRANRLHFNFMARGEAFLNESITSTRVWNELVRKLRIKMIDVDAGLQPQFNLSTIMPKDGKYPNRYEWESIFFLNSEHAYRTAIFYSLYSLNPAFRKRWLPNAMEPRQALEFLNKWQRSVKHIREVVLHWALIEGENDSLEDAEAILALVKDVGLQARFNLVRYNPYSEAQGKEPSEITIQKYFELMSSGMTRPDSRIVPRVGFDAKASCGMFVEVKR